jgi:hypothetical protein
MAMPALLRREKGAHLVSPGRRSRVERRSRARLKRGIFKPQRFASVAETALRSYGTTLAWRADLRPDVLAVAAGCFTDKNFPPPLVSMWEETMCGWVKLPEGTQHFPRARLS